MTVELGSFRTDFAGRSLAVSEKNIDDYAETFGKRKFRDDLFWRGKSKRNFRLEKIQFANLMNKNK